MKLLLSTAAAAVVGVLLLGTVDSHSILKQSFPAPKGSRHNKPAKYMEKLRHQRKVNANNYGDRFAEQYAKIMNATTKNLNETPDFQCQE